MFYVNITAAIWPLDVCSNGGSQVYVRVTIILCVPLFIVLFPLTPSCQGPNRPPGALEKGLGPYITLRRITNLNQPIGLL